MAFFKHLRSSLAYRLLLYTIPAALLLAYLVYQAFFMVVADSITALAKDFSEQNVRYNTEKASRIILRERDISQRLASSSTLLAWALDESDEALKKAAINLLERHRSVFRDHSYDMVIDQSGHYYYNDRNGRYTDKQLRYTLSPDASKDRWYYATKKLMQRPGVGCQINVDPDTVLNTTKLWINCPMRYDHAVIGMMGTGIDLSDFIRIAVKNNQVGVRILYINPQGWIQAADDTNLIDFSSVIHRNGQPGSSKNIFSLFDRKQDRTALRTALERVVDQPHTETIVVTIHGDPFVISLKAIQAIGWINVTMVDLHKQHIGRYFLPVSLLVGGGMLLMFVLLIFLLHRLVLSRLHALDGNICKVKIGDYRIISGDHAPDEIGRLSDGFADMAAAVENHTVTLKCEVDERTAKLEQAKQQSQLEREHSEAVINSAMDGIIEITDCGMIRSFNPAAEVMFGYAASEMIGVNVCLLMPESDRSQHDGYLRRFHGSGGVRVVGKEREVTARRKDGSTFPMALSVNRMRFKDDGYFIGTMRDITDRKKAEKKIITLAHFDTLTGLPNRNMFLDRMEKELARFKRHKIGFAVFFIDLDGFKAVNDTLGHEAGDCVLKTVAQRLRSTMRDMDTIARLGGDEFTAILPEVTKREEADIVAEKMIAALGEPMVVQGNRYQGKLSASIGIAFCPSNGDDIDSLIRHADRAMYRAKQGA